MGGGRGVSTAHLTAGRPHQPAVADMVAKAAGLKSAQAVRVRWCLQEGDWDSGAREGPRQQQGSGVGQAGAAGPGHAAPAPPPPAERSPLRLSFKAGRGQERSPTGGLGASVAGSHARDGSCGQRRFGPIVGYCAGLQVGLVHPHALQLALPSKAHHHIAAGQARGRSVCPQVGLMPGK